MEIRNFKLLALCLLFFPFLGVGNVIGNSTFLQCWQIASSIIIAIYLLKKRKMLKISPPVLILLLFSSYEMVTSIYNGVFTYGIAFSIFYRVLSAIFITYQFDRKDYDFIHVLHIILSILVIINFPSVLNSIQLSEYDKIFLLGGKNTLAIFAVSSIFFCYLSDYIRHGRTTRIGYCVIVLNLATMFLGGSSTGIIIGIVMAMFTVFGKWIKINPYCYIILYIVALFLVLHSELIENIPLLYDFITNSLNKNLTFTSRTAIWGNSRRYIADNMLGYGRGNQIVYSFTHSTNENHNAILELLLADGAPGLGLFLMYLCACIKTKKNIAENRAILNVCFFTIFALMCVGLVESIINNNILWWLMLITYYMREYKRD